MRRTTLDLPRVPVTQIRMGIRRSAASMARRSIKRYKKKAAEHPAATQKAFSVLSSFIREKPFDLLDLLGDSDG